jgi:hypothetical protein
VLAPLASLGARLVALGEVIVDPGADTSAVLNGQLFADRAIYKLRLSRSVRPDVLVLGSSRVGEFRAQMFATCGSRPNCFLNATGGASTLSRAADFIDLLATYGALPRVLVLGVDIWELNPNFELLRQPQVEPLQRSPTEQLDYALAVTIKTAVLMSNDPAVRDAVLGRAPIPVGASGLNAILRGTGDRPDGSTKYSESDWRLALSQSDAARSLAYLHLLDIGGYEFEPFDRADERSLGDLERLLAVAQAHAMQVVVFTPPFGSALLSAMRSQPHFADGIDDAERRLDALLTQRGVPHRVALDLGSYGCADDEHLDGLHVSEVCGARILHTLLGQPEVAAVLGTYADPVALTTLIERRRSSYALTDEP